MGPRKEPQNGGWPAGGNVDGEAYAVCPSCGKEIKLIAKVRRDILTAVEVRNEECR